MNFDKYRELIKKEAVLLSHKERVVLCLICCARLSPLYSKFSSVEGWGDEFVLSQSRQTAKSWLCEVDVDIDGLSEQLSEVIPDTEDFGSALGSFALNASVAHASLLEQIKNDESAAVLEVLQVCYDTLDCYVQALLGSSCHGDVSEQDIENHAVITNEINWQLNLFKQIKGNQNLSKFTEDKVVEQENNELCMNCLSLEYS